MKKKWYALWIIVVVLLLVFVAPYAKVEILTINAEEKLAQFDVSCFDNIYCEGTPAIYDCKIYSYQKEKNAKVLYVLGDCEFGVLVDLEWNESKECWELADGRNVWSTHGGNAQEFYWPLYYANKVFPWVGA